MRDDDSDTLFAWINDRELVLLSAPFRAVERAEHHQWLRRAREADDVVLFAIRVLPGGDLIGTCQLRAIDRLHRSAELRIRIGSRTHWGRGFGSEAVLLLVDIGFSELRLHRIYLHVLADNKRARRAYLRTGFTEEGRLREAALIDGAWKDVTVMGVLEDDRSSRTRPVSA